MGKDSLIKSTTKKKAPAKKTAAKSAPAKKKSAAKKAAPKKTAAKKAAPKKAAPKKAAPKKAVPKKTVKKAAPAKAKAPAKKKAVVKSKASAKKPTVAELLKRQFDRPAQATQYAPPKTSTTVADAPPVTDSPQIKALLLKPQGLGSAKPAAATPAPKAAPKPTPAPKPEPKAAPQPKPAPEPAGTPPLDTGSVQPPDEGSRKLMTRLIIAIGVTFLVILAASKMNASKFYLENKDGALLVYQGNFAPKGRHLLMTLPGVGMPGETKETYRESTIYPMIYAYFIQRADNLLTAPGLPDFDGIRDYLKKAKTYAIGSDLKDDLRRRTNGIDLLINLYKADVAASRNTPESIVDALAYLKAAGRLNPDPAQEALIEKKAEEFMVQQAALDAEAKAKEEKAKSE